jgi:hypothetical protein
MPYGKAYSGFQLHVFFVGAITRIAQAKTCDFQGEDKLRPYRAKVALK